MQHHPGHHHGAFVDAEKAAAKLNSPERDGWQRPEVIVAALELAAGETVADLGAGTGYMVGHLSRAVGESGTVIAVDVEEAMVAFLASRVAELGPATVKPRKAGADDPGLARESVDAVLVLDMWHHLGLQHHGKQHDVVEALGSRTGLQAIDRDEHWPTRKPDTPQWHPRGRMAYAEKIFAALKPGGRLVVVEATIEAEVGPPAVMRVGPEVVERELVGAGFRAEVVRDALPRHYLVAGKKLLADSL